MLDRAEWAPMVRALLHRRKTMAVGDPSGTANEVIRRRPKESPAGAGLGIQPTR